jgi:hypothetical protein
LPALAGLKLFAGVCTCAKTGNVEAATKAIDASATKAALMKISPVGPAVGHETLAHVPEKWTPVFRKEHAPLEKK